MARVPGIAKRNHISVQKTRLKKLRAGVGLALLTTILRDWWKERALPAPNKDDPKNKIDFFPPHTPVFASICKTCSQNTCKNICHILVTHVSHPCKTPANACKTFPFNSAH
jgi:hypothetical protein